MIWITAQVHLGLRPSLTMTRTPILLPALLMEMEKTEDCLTASGMSLVVTIQSEQARSALLGPMMVVAGALTRTIGIWTPEPGITIQEGEEGVVEVGIDKLTGAGEAVVGEPRSARQDLHRIRSGVVPKTTPACHPPPISVPGTTPA